VSTLVCGNAAPLGQFCPTILPLRHAFLRKYRTVLQAVFLHVALVIESNSSGPLICDREGRDAARRSVIVVVVILVERFAASQGDSRGGRT